MVANSVTVSAVSERHRVSTSSSGWMTASWARGALRLRIVASTGVPSTRAISCTLARAPNVIIIWERPTTSAMRWPITALAGEEVAITMPAVLVTRSHRPGSTAERGRSPCMARCTALAPSARPSPTARSSRSDRISATISMSPDASAMVWWRCEKAWMTAPTPTVTRKAMMSAGTARRSAGSALRRRRYAGRAIDSANPLMESGRAHALATSARAIAGLRSPPDKNPPVLGATCRISPNHAIRIQDF